MLTIIATQASKVKVAKRARDAAWSAYQSSRSATVLTLAIFKSSQAKYRAKMVVYASVRPFEPLIITLQIYEGLITTLMKCIGSHATNSVTTWMSDPILTL